MHRGLLIPIAAAAAAAMIATPSPAACGDAFCECVPDSTFGRTLAAQVAARKDAADAVVLATALREDTLADGGPIVVRLSVARVWKGPATDTISIAVRSAPPRVSSCDLRLVVGSRYLVFAQEAGGHLWARRCSGTREATEASVLLGALGEGRLPTR